MNVRDSNKWSSFGIWRKENRREEPENKREERKDRIGELGR
jgi:hypothetical protein